MSKATRAKHKGTWRASDLAGVVDAVAPFKLAEEWDNVGLQAGRPGQPVGRVLVALEATPAVVAEARRRGADALLLHHPVIFRPLRNLVESSPAVEIAAECLRAGIALVIAHTNYDAVPHGTNGELADRLGLVDRKTLFPVSPPGRAFKIAVFTPCAAAAAVIDAMARAGAGTIGNYSHCTFRSPGTGTFKPLPGANPTVGTVGNMEEVGDEERIETVCPARRLDRVIAAMRDAHPYEEVAFDVYPLEPVNDAGYGFGIVGRLEKPGSWKSFLARCRRVYGVRRPKTVPCADDRVIKRVAVFSGSGGEAARRWRPGMADVLVTGEMTHHDAALVRDAGAGAVLLGHFESEAIAMPRLAEQVRTHELWGGRPPEIIVSEDEASPVALP